MANDIEAAAEESFPPTNPKLKDEPPKRPAVNSTNSETEKTLILKTSMSQVPASLRQYFDFIKINKW